MLPAIRKYAFIALASLSWLHAPAQFLGGAADGHSLGFLGASPCSPYFSGQADGFASFFLANPDTCGQYEGGFQDGAANVFLANPVPCTSFMAGQQDGFASNFLANPVPCTAFFSSQQDGFASGYVPCGPLLVSASELYGRNIEEDGELWWYTFSEHDNLGFILERSPNQLDWMEIAFLPGQASSNSRIKYQVLDTLLLSGINYYRWRQIDVTGTETQSNIVALVKSSNGQMSCTIYPNPLATGGLLHIHLQYPETASLDLRVINALGNVVWQDDREMEAGGLQMDLNTEGLAAGVYILSLQAGNDRITQRFILQ